MPEEFEHIRAGPFQSSVPIIPDSIVGDICSSAGFNTDDVRIIRVISLAAQYHLANISNDAMRHHRSSFSSKSGQNVHRSKDSKILTMENLSPALKDNGINCQKPPYFV